MTEDGGSEDEYSGSSGQENEDLGNEMKDNDKKSDEDEKENKENKENENEEEMEVETKTSILERNWPEYGIVSDAYCFNAGLTPRLCPPCTGHLVPIRTKSFKIAKSGIRLDYSTCQKCHVPLLDEKQNNIIFVHEHVLLWDLVPSTHGWNCWNCVQKTFIVCCYNCNGV